MMCLENPDAVKLLEKYGLNIREFMKKLRHLSNKNKQIDREFMRQLEYLTPSGSATNAVYMQHSRDKLL